MLDIVQKFINDVKHLKVAVIGETIIDEFIPVHYEGNSMKSVCPVYRLTGGEKQVQMGGAHAIANHLKSFVSHIDLITNTENEIVKTRYIDAYDGKKHTEINTFNTSNFGEITVDTNDYDVVIIADFGHGFCNKIKINNGFHLMCQTNSNNFGFNRTSKWKNHRKKSVCLDLREASLQMNKNISHKDNGDFENDILELYNYEMNTDLMLVTLGGSGSAFTDGKFVKMNSAFPSDFNDSIGAGDTFFAFASIQASIQEEVKELIIPSLAASLSTTWLCNEKSVTPQTLLEYASKFI